MASLHYIFSSMNSGKTTEALQANYNYRERGMKTILMKPSIDNRDGESVIKSRIGLEHGCETFGPHENLFTRIKHSCEGVSCVIVDEAQFMSPGQVDDLARVVDELDIPVLCYGLRTDFQGQGFPGSARLLAIADEMRECRAICWCAKRSSFVLRLDEQGNVIKEGEQVVIGGNDRYVAVCRKHFYMNKPHG